MLLHFLLAGMFFQMRSLLHPFPGIPLTPSGHGSPLCAFPLASDGGLVVVVVLNLLSPAWVGFFFFYRVCTFALKALGKSVGSFPLNGKAIFSNMGKGFWQNFVPVSLWLLTVPLTPAYTEEGVFFGRSVQSVMFCVSTWWGPWETTWMWKVFPVLFLVYFCTQQFITDLPESFRQCLVEFTSGKWVLMSYFSWSFPLNLRHEEGKPAVAQLSGEFQKLSICSPPCILVCVWLMWECILSIFVHPKQKPSSY